MKIFSFLFCILFCSASFAQSENNLQADRTVTVRSKEGEKVNLRLHCLPEKVKLTEPILLVDDEQMNYTVLYRINAKDIERIEVVQADKALKKYGDKAKGGAVLVYMKASAAKRAYI